VDGEGQAIAESPLTPEGTPRLLQVAPESADPMMDPPELDVPTAKHVVALGHAIPAKSAVPEGSDSLLHVDPELVVTRILSPPMTKHLALETQATPVG
jgi:hypothetical protein